MAEFPSLPLFTDAFIADTVHLNAQQTGAYLMLLMCAWRTADCMLPDDDRLLARFARMDGRAWAANKDVVMSFFRRDPDTQKWYQRRLIDERRSAEAIREKRSHAGKSRHLKDKETGSAHAPANDQQNASPLSLTLSHTSPTDNSNELSSGDVGSGASEIPTAPPPPPPPDFDGENSESIPARAVVRLAGEFELPSEWGRYAEALGWSFQEIINESTKFHGYWTAGKGAGKRRNLRGWRQAWNNWIDIAGKRRAA